MQFKGREEVTEFDQQHFQAEGLFAQNSSQGHKEHLRLGRAGLRSAGGRRRTVKRHHADLRIQGGPEDSL
ncbi:Hypothetical protein SCF082_LOCUS39875 [Durusdinium trenchii]|uniref:Uncharacterized protein n=1 Tax=Durusdinium trenchii TaxID=1381693 RepID=A0ABP0Q925_9DINO